MPKNSKRRLARMKRADPRPDLEQEEEEAASVQQEEEEILEVIPRPDLEQEEEEEQQEVVDYDNPQPGCSGLGRVASMKQEKEELANDLMWRFDKKGWLALDILRHPEVVDEFLRAMREAAETSDDSD